MPLTVNSPPLITWTTKDYNRKPGLFRYQGHPTLPTDSTCSECWVQKVEATLPFFSLCKCKKSNMADFYGPGGFFVEHTELNLGVKFQVIRTYGVKGVAFQNSNFKCLIITPPCGQLGSYFLRSWFTWFILLLIIINMPYLHKFLWAGMS